ncbi:hypothetical protein ABH900_001629 [Stenotrophomonas sp. AN71]
MSVLTEVVVPLLSALGGALIGGVAVLSFGWTLIFLKEPSVLEGDLSEIKTGLQDLSCAVEALKGAACCSRGVSAKGPEGWPLT